MKLYHFFLSIGLGLILSLLVWFSKKEKPKEVHVRKEIYNFDSNKCPGDTVKLKVTDPYLNGILEQYSEVKISLNLFKCKPIHRNDIVLYRYSEFKNPVLRRVVAEPGDQFSVEKDVINGWVLVVNQKPVLSFNGKPYLFGGNQAPPLKLAQNSLSGILGHDQTILFSSFPPGEKDSGVFGVISVGDVIGKVVNE
ncbi:MAG: S26 family signal peptidase [Bdellovibrio sp.]